jgi:hypothetical protein
LYIELFSQFIREAQHSKDYGETVAVTLTKYFYRFLQRAHLPSLCPPFFFLSFPSPPFFPHSPLFALLMHSLLGHFFLLQIFPPFPIRTCIIFSSSFHIPPPSSEEPNIQLRNLSDVEMLQYISNRAIYMTQINTLMHLVLIGSYENLLGQIVHFFIPFWFIKWDHAQTGYYNCQKICIIFNINGDC